MNIDSPHSAVLKIAFLSYMLFSMGFVCCSFSFCPHIFPRRRLKRIWCYAFCLMGTTVWSVWSLVISPPPSRSQGTGVEKRREEKDQWEHLYSFLLVPTLSGSYADSRMLSSAPSLSGLLSNARSCLFLGTPTLEGVYLRALDPTLNPHCGSLGQ